MKLRRLYRLVAAATGHFANTDAMLQCCQAVMRGGKIPLALESLTEVLQCEDALGRIYQAINAPALEKAYRATAGTGRKFHDHEIPRVTQLFTPRWVVEWLLQNSLGRMWIEMYSESPLKKQWKWLVEPGLKYSKPKKIEDMRICDPACGTMNFGLVAIDMLRLMHAEQDIRSGKTKRSQRQIDASILKNNLFGFDIDATAIDIAQQSIHLKTGLNAKKLFVADSLMDTRMESGFDVIATNPPYLSSRNLDAIIVARLKEHYPTAWRDACACFIARSLDCLNPGGRAAVLAMQSFMFTGGFTKLRAQLSQSATIETAAHFGPGLFDIGNPGTLQTVAVVMKKSVDEKQKAVFFRLINEPDKKRALACGRNALRFEIGRNDLSSFPRHAWMYWLNKRVRRVLAEFPKLGKIAPPRQGLATTDNARFVRYWWEVEPPESSGKSDKWIPYAKGGRFRRWYESAPFRVNWEKNGAEIKQAIIHRYPYLNGKWKWVAKNSEWYGKPGITYSYLTSSHFSARLLEKGTYFDVAGSALFPDDPLPLLGVLNSSSAQELLSAINPTVNFQVGDLRELPVPPNCPEELRKFVGDAIDLTRQLDTFDQTSPDFVQPAEWGSGHSNQIKAKRAEAENHIDRIVAGLYGMRPRMRKKPDAEANDLDQARRWINFAISKSLDGVADVNHQFTARILDTLQVYSDNRAADQINSAVGGILRFLQRDFASWHDRLYRYRPVLWMLAVNDKMTIIDSASANGEILHRAGISIGQKWRRNIDIGIKANLRPFVTYLMDRELQKRII